MSRSIPLLLFECFLLIHPVLTIFNRSYPGYLFSIPDSGTVGQLSQSGAQIRCSSNGSKLLEIPNSQVQSYVLEFISAVRSNLNGFSDSPIITNGMRSDQFQGWTWVNRKSAKSIRIDNQEPGLSQSFGFVYLNGSVMATSPTDKRNYICEVLSDCANGVKVSERCYIVITEALSWFAARNSCLERSGDLASFDLSTDNTMLLTSLESLGLNQSGEYWIGIRRQVWTWLQSNAEVKYSQWSDGRPIYSLENACICLDPKEWKWIECDCAKIYQFICYSVWNSSVTLPGSVTPSSAATISETISAAIISAAISSAGTSTPLVTSPVELKDTNNGFSLTSGQSLGLGLGLGIGGCLIIVAIIVIIYLRMTRCISSRDIVGHQNLKLSLSSEVIIPPSSDIHYAVVQKQQEDETMTTDVGENPTHVEYAELSPSSKQTAAASEGGERQSIDTSILIGNRATLRPPPHKTYPNHVAIN